jgi:hypothetical protein
VEVGGGGGVFHIGEGTHCRMHCGLLDVFYTWRRTCRRPL